MQLSKHLTSRGTRWALDGQWLDESLTLGDVLQHSRDEAIHFLEAHRTTTPAEGPLVAPIDAHQEVWASGVTYLRSRVAREAESQMGDVYERVYAAQRPELFFKALGFRVIGEGQPIRVRADSRWNVPEPELTLLVNAHGELMGYCAGNDVSSRDIEGENPLYLPQAKVYAGSCALGPGIQLASPEAMRDLPIELRIEREVTEVFSGSTRSSRMKRSYQELVDYLTREMSFPRGVFLMTGTGIVPPEDFNLRRSDLVRIRVGELALENPVTD